MHYRQKQRKLITSLSVKTSNRNPPIINGSTIIVKEILEIHFNKLIFQNE
jgi:hypothetical protein